MLTHKEQPSPNVTPSIALLFPTAKSTMQCEHLKTTVLCCMRMTTQHVWAHHSHVPWTHSRVTLMETPSERGWWPCTSKRQINVYGLAGVRPLLESSDLLKCLVTPALSAYSNTCYLPLQGAIISSFLSMWSLWHLIWQRRHSRAGGGLNMCHRGFIQASQLVGKW